MIEESDNPAVRRGYDVLFVIYELGGGAHPWSSVRSKCVPHAMTREQFNIAIRRVADWGYATMADGEVLLTHSGYCVARWQERQLLDEDG